MVVPVSTAVAVTTGSEIVGATAIIALRMSLLQADYSIIGGDHVWLLPDSRWSVHRWLACGFSKWVFCFLLGYTVVASKFIWPCVKRQVASTWQVFS